MKFFNKRRPNSVVTSKKNHKRIVRFVDGEFETNDPILIKRLKPYFKHGLRGKSKKKGKSFEEMYGKKKAKLMKRKISKTLRGE